jgi:hypothetical protein
MEKDCKRQCEKDNLYDFASVVLPNRIYFGPVPNQTQLELLHHENFKYIINVMSIKEKVRFGYTISPEKLNMQLMGFPISDQRIPLHTPHFLKWIEYLGHIMIHMKPNEKMYIHCRGGHGRSALVAGCLFYWYCKIYRSQPLTGEDCIRHMTFAHCQRKLLNPKYLHQKCPVAKCQQQFIKSLENFKKW